MTTLRPGAPYRLAGNEVEVVDLGPLTAREAQALLWAAEGKTAWEVGRILGVSEATAAAHLTRAAEKLAAVNRAHLIARAFVRGVLRAVHAAVVLCVLFVASAGTDVDMRRAPRPPRIVRTSSGGRRQDA